MANPTQVQIDKLTTNATRWDNIVNGSPSATVALDSFTVKTVAGYLQELQAINPRGSWGSGTVYALKDVVVNSSIVYICTIAHTGGTFATDLAAGKWAIYQLDVTSAITFGDDFTVDTNTLHVDSTNNRVGIGTTSNINTVQAGNAELSVETNFYTLINSVTFNNGANVSPFLGLTKARGTQSSPVAVQDGDQLGGILAAGYNGSEYRSSANIIFLQEGLLHGGKITFLTSNSGSSTPVERLCINNVGNVGIGSNTPNTKLEIEKTQADDLSSGQNAHLYLSNTTTINNTGRTAIFLSTTSIGATTYGISLSADRRQANGSPYLNIRRHFNDTAGTSSLLIDNNGNIGVGTEAPDTVAILELDSTTKGFLPPRMTETQRDAISTPPAGLIIYNTTDSKLNLYGSFGWEEIVSA